MEKLIAYIQKTIPKLKIEEKLLGEAFQKEVLTKDALLLDFGQVCEHYYFVNKRALRIFFYDDNGEEYTSWIAFENYFFTEQFSYTDLQRIICQVDCGWIKGIKTALHNLHFARPTTFATSNTCQMWFIKEEKTEDIQ